jgi:hypothetical protein
MSILARTVLTEDTLALDVAVTSDVVLESVRLDFALLDMTGNSYSFAGPYDGNSYGTPSELLSDCLRLSISCCIARKIVGSVPARCVDDDLDFGGAKRGLLAWKWTSFLALGGLTDFTGSVGGNRRGEYPRCVSLF